MTKLSERGLLGLLTVIVISTDATAARMKHLYALGAHGYLSKPFLPEALRAEVERAMGAHDVHEPAGTALSEAAREVLETMCFIDAGEVPDPMSPGAALVPPGIAAQVEFRGYWTGRCIVEMPETCARAISGEFHGSARSGCGGCGQHDRADLRVRQYDLRQHRRQAALPGDRHPGSSAPDPPVARSRSRRRKPRPKHECRALAGHGRGRGPRRFETGAAA